MERKCSGARRDGPLVCGAGIRGNMGEYTMGVTRSKYVYSTVHEPRVTFEWTGRSGQVREGDGVRMEVSFRAVGSHY